MKFEQFCHGELQSFAEWSAEFGKICRGKLWALVIIQRKDDLLVRCTGSCKQRKQIWTSRVLELKHLNSRFTCCLTVWNFSYISSTHIYCWVMWCFHVSLELDSISGVEIICGIICNFVSALVSITLLLVRVYSYGSCQFYLSTIEIIHILLCRYASNNVFLGQQLGWVFGMMSHLSVSLSACNICIVAKPYVIMASAIVPLDREMTQVLIGCQ